MINVFVFFFLILGNRNLSFKVSPVWVTEKFSISKLKFKYIIQTVKFTGCMKSLIIPIRRNLLTLFTLSSPCPQWLILLSHIRLAGTVLEFSRMTGLLKSPRSLLLDHHPFTMPLFLNDFLLSRSKFLHILFNRFLNLNANSF